MRWLRAFVVWLMLMGAEVIHGILRALFLAPKVGDLRARQLGVFTGSLLILVIAYLSIGWVGVRNKSLLAVGFAWLLLTLAFEIGFGHFVFGYSWERLASDYNLSKGGLLPVGLLVLFLSPLIAAKLRESPR